MKIKQTFILILFFICFSSFAQLKVIMTFKDGKEVNDEVLVTKKILFSTATNTQYNFGDVKELKVNNGSEIEHYYPIGVKLNKKTSKISFGLGMKVYDSEYLEIYHARFHYFNLDKRYNYVVKYNPKFETFIKKKGDTYAYSVGCVDGLGCEGISRRIKQFFEDCPDVFEQIKSRKISNRDIISIANYYNEHCGKN